MKEVKSLRDARLRLNQIEYWIKNNPHRFSPTRLVVLRSQIEDAATPFHVWVLEAHMREGLLPATIPSGVRTVRNQPT